MNLHDRAAPLYTDAFVLCDWILGHFDNAESVLEREICQTGLQLLEALTLALDGRRRELQLEIADERLIWLRTQLRLAEMRGYLNQPQLLHALKQCDSVGRQIGGWLRSLEAV